MPACCLVKQSLQGQFQIPVLPRLPSQLQRVRSQFQDCLLPPHAHECLSKSLLPAAGLRSPIRRTGTGKAVASQAEPVAQNCSAKHALDRFQCYSSLASVALNTTTRESACLLPSWSVVNLHVEIGHG